MGQVLPGERNFGNTFSAASAGGMATLQTSFRDDHFHHLNDKNFLFDDNSLEAQFVGDDISCPLADNILNACNSIIDAAQYIGVTFDVTVGYNTRGYRQQITKMWCANARKFANNRFDVPDFMHVQEWLQEHSHFSRNHMIYFAATKIFVVNRLRAKPL